MHYLKTAVFTLVSLSSIIPFCAGAILHKRADEIALYDKVNKEGTKTTLEKGKCYTSDKTALKIGSISVPPRIVCTYRSSNDCTGNHVRHLLSPGVNDTAAYLDQVHREVNSLKCEDIAPPK
ncbi:hypothetical protein GX51_05938 [Blastomyces parvus]|uniref:Uncharacterized protein n=1 Tax=Blastomyces parvus TaxID=2060905 RepID=A0A2B7WUQ9_9EURO|nr:hypothetical protein GX51_05938 [Blastomyces parvus]